MTTTARTKSDNLCEIVVREMVSIGFRTESIKSFTGTDRFQFAINEHPIIQRNSLIMNVMDLFLTSPDHMAHDNIRIALRVAEDPQLWLNDFRKGVLVYLHRNEDVYFPVEH